MNNHGPSFAEERRRQIAEQVASQGRVRLGDLVQEHGVTEPTIRKDLEELQQRGLLKRTHGGAIVVEHMQEEPLRNRTAHHPEAKERIARAVSAHVRPGMSLFLDSGTTLEFVAQALTVPNLNVVTNAVEVATILSGRLGIRHTLVGGVLRPLGGSLVGAIALENLRHFTVDLAILGASGLNGDGISVADVAEAQIKQAAVDRARTVILAMDSSKFGRSDFIQVGTLDRIDRLVTEAATPTIQEWCDADNTILEVAPPS